MAQYGYPQGAAYNGQYQGQMPEGSYPPYSYGQPLYTSQPPGHGYANNMMPQMPPAHVPYQMAAQQSFQYNAGAIPGLGGFAAPVYGQQSGMAQGYPQQSHPQQAPPQMNPSAVGQGYYMPPQSFHEVQPVIQQQEQSEAPVEEAAEVEMQDGAQADDEFEEGELDEGVFDDLYEPVVHASEPTPIERIQPPSPKRPVDGERDEKQFNQESRHAKTNGQVAAIPPVTVTQNTGHVSPELYSPQPSAVQTLHTTTIPIQPAAIMSKPDTNGQTKDKHDASDPSITDTGPKNSQLTDANPTPATMFQTVAEARNEAKKAILKLWPLEVRYQTFIDEGFDEKLVKTLFAELNLGSKATSPPAQQKDTTRVVASQLPPPIEKASVVNAAATTQESRKDRIARLLAEKAQKATTSTATPILLPTPASASAAISAQAVAPTLDTGAASAATKLKAEKSLLLQQKMEALRKSRDARAQIGAKPVNDQQTMTPTSVMLSTPIPASTEVAPSSGTATPLTDLIETALPAEEQGPKDSHSMIPGLVRMASASLLANSRKRPVAADFVEYNTGIKRPFGQDRQDTSLVIELSDEEGEEGEEGEIEMEVESDAETRQQSRTIRDFPPLTNTTPNTQRHLPTTTSAASGDAQPNSQAAKVEYEAKMTEIAKFKEAILAKEAAARARLQAKQGSATPVSVGQNATPLVDVQGTKSLFSETSSVSSSGAAVPFSMLGTTDVEMRPTHAVPVVIPAALTARNITPATQLTPAQLAKQRRKAQLEAELAALEDDISRDEAALQLQGESEQAAEGQEDDQKSSHVRGQNETQIVDRVDDAMDTNEQQPPVNSITAGELPMHTEMETDMFQPADSLRADQPQVSVVEGNGMAVAVSAKSFATIPQVEDLTDMATTTTTTVTDTSVAAQEGVDTNITIPEQPTHITQQVPATTQDDVAVDAAQHIAATDIVDLTEDEGEIFEDEGSATSSKSPVPDKASDMIMAEVEAPTISEEAVVPQSDVMTITESTIATSAPELETGEITSVVEAPRQADLAQTEIGHVEAVHVNVEPTEIMQPDTAFSNNAMMNDSLAAEPALVADAESAPTSSHRTPPEAKVTVSSAVLPAVEEMPNAAGSVLAVATPSTPLIVERAPLPDVIDEPRPLSRTSFKPYHSALRYFTAYRQHPEYDTTVNGGLKSLTYSNRIDPNRPLCPDDLEGRPCPRGDSCEFQHVRSMNIPDDQIILELGSSDDFTGERKTQFNQGLRELLASYRNGKVRNFGTIAQGVVDFRRRFLGDESKVLNLDGVTI